jgi:predicted transcriptional regulator
MTQHHGGSTPPQGQRSTPDVARDEAAGVARTAADRGSEVAGTVGEQASRVTSETTRQARNLVHEGMDQLSGQARQGQQRAADGLHKLADQLHQMSERGAGQGVAPEVARQAADKTRGLASWLENRDPGAVVEEVRRLARRRPAAFLVGATLAGVAVGRLTRGVVAAQQADDDGPDGRQAGNGDRRGGRGPGSMPQPTPPVMPATTAPYPGQQAYPPPAPGVPPTPRPVPPPPATTRPEWMNQ